LETISKLESEMEDRLINLQVDAEEDSFERHSLNMQDFERKIDDDFDFTLWKKEAENHYEALDSISENLRTYEQIKQQMVDIEKTIANTQQQIDQTIQEEKDWVNIFEKDKQDKMDEIHAWTERYSVLNVDGELLQQTSRHLLRLYEPHTFETIRTPFLHASQDYQLWVNEQIAIKNSELKVIETELAEHEHFLEELKQKRDPDPPNRQEETKEARQWLKEGNCRFIPFYEAVEFRDHVEEDVRNKIEAALMDIGLLDALITEKPIPVKHDRVIQPNPQMMAHTLADYLLPDVEGDTEIKASRIDEVLRSILVDSENDNDTATTIRVDGTYSIGLMEGHAVHVEKVRFIGKNARKRYREEQMKQITLEIEKLSSKSQQVTSEIQTWKEKVEAAQTAMEFFPNDDDLQVSFKQIETSRFQMKQLEKQLVIHDQKMNEILQNFEKIKRELDAVTRGLNIEFSHDAYHEAKQIQRRYEKDLSELEKLHVTYRHEQRNKVQTTKRLKEIEVEVDEIKGELNLLHDKKVRLEQNIAEIEKQLQTHGMENIRKQIQDVQKDISQTKSELNTIINELPRNETHLGTLEQTITEQQQKMRFSKEMINA